MNRVSGVAFGGGLVLCLALFAAAIQFSDSLPAEAQSAATEAESPALAPFPRIARDILGDELRLDKPPRAIASQSLVTDHFLFAIVPHDHIVGVSSVTHDPRYSHVAEIVSRMDVAVATDPEAILRRRPDLTLVSQWARAEYVDVFRSAGNPVFRMQTNFEDFGGILKGLKTTGYLTGEDLAAERESRCLLDRVDAARMRRPPGAKPARVLAYSSFGNTFGKGSLFDHILSELGAINVASEHGIGPYGSISSEQVAFWNPDWIVAGGEPGSSAQLRARLLTDIGIAATAAGRSGRVVIVPNLWYLSMSQHAAGLMQVLADALYPTGK